MLLMPLWIYFSDCTHVSDDLGKRKLEVYVNASYQLRFLVFLGCGISRAKEAERPCPPRGLCLLLSGQVCDCQVLGHPTARTCRNEVISAALASVSVKSRWGALWFLRSYRNLRVHPTPNIPSVWLFGSRRWSDKRSKKNNHSHHRWEPYVFQAWFKHRQYRSIKMDKNSNSMKFVCKRESTGDKEMKGLSLWPMRWWLLGRTVRHGVIRNRRRGWPRSTWIGKRKLPLWLPMLVGQQINRFCSLYLVGSRKSKEANGWEQNKQRG